MFSNLQSPSQGHQQQEPLMPMHDDQKEACTAAEQATKMHGFSENTDSQQFNDEKESVLDPLMNKQTSYINNIVENEVGRGPNENHQQQEALMPMNDDQTEACMAANLATEMHGITENSNSQGSCDEKESVPDPSIKKQTSYINNIMENEVGYRPSQDNQQQEALMPMHDDQKEACIAAKQAKEMHDIAENPQVSNDEKESLPDPSIKKQTNNIDDTMENEVGYGLRKKRQTAFLDTYTRSVCQFCKKLFSTPQNLRRHIQRRRCVVLGKMSHFDRGPKVAEKMEEQICQRPLSSKKVGGISKKLNYSTKKHRKKKRKIHKKVECVLCGSTFASPANLKRHLRLKVCQLNRKKLNGEKNISGINCVLCGTTFSSEGNLNRHLKLKICELNRNNVSRYSGLGGYKNNHVRKCSSNSKSSKVKKRNSSTPNSMVKSEHEIYHEECSACVYGFNEVSDLFKHIDCHKLLVNLSQSCKVCVQGFRNPSYLSLHLQWHDDLLKLYDKTKDPGKVKFSYSGFEKDIKNILFNYQSSQKPCNTHEYMFSDVLDREVNTSNRSFVTPESGNVIETRYKCKICHMVFSRIRLFQKHVSREHGIKFYACYICGLEVTTASILTKHLSFVHSTAGEKFSCEFCSNTYRYAQGLTRHMLRSHKWEAQMLKDSGKLLAKGSSHSISQNAGCNQDDATLSENSKMANMMEHYSFSEEPEMHDYTVCDDSFLDNPSNENSFSYADFMIETSCEISGKPKMHAPTICDDSLDYETSEENELSPSDLDSNRETSSHETAHIDGVVTYSKKLDKGDKTVPLRCEICSIIFRSQRGLRRHMEIHQGTYSCKTCERSFGSPYHLRRHIKLVHSRSMYSCPNCNKKINTFQQYKKHKARCTASKTKKKYYIPHDANSDETASPSWKKSSEVNLDPMNGMLSQSGEYLEQQPHANDTVNCEVCGKELLPSEISKLDIPQLSGMNPNLCEICIEVIKRNANIISVRFYSDSKNEVDKNVESSSTITQNSLSKKGFKSAKSKFKKRKELSVKHSSKAKKNKRKEIKDKARHKKLLTQKISKSKGQPKFFRAEILRGTTASKSHLEFSQDLFTSAVEPKYHLDEMKSQDHTQSISIVDDIYQDLLNSNNEESSLSDSNQDKGRTYMDIKQNSSCVTNATSDLMWDHQSHSGSQKYQCHLCEKSFKHNNTLTKHLGHVHKLDKQFRCNVCKRYYMTRESLQGHMKCHNQSHKAEKAKDNQLVFEPQFMDNDSFHFDAQKFNPANFLPMPHEDLLDSNKEDSSLSDSILDMNQSNMNIKQNDSCVTNATSDLIMWDHQSHSGSQKYQCHLCEKSFKLNCSLTKHLGHIHKLDKQFRCSVCKRYYMTKESLQGHMKCHNQSQKVENDKDNQLVLEPLLMHNDNFHFDAQEFNPANFLPMPQGDLLDSNKEESSLSDSTLYTSQSKINIKQNDSCVTNKTTDLIICETYSLNGNKLDNTLNKTEPYECPVCKILCSDKSSLERHMQDHYKVNSSFKLDKGESTYSDHLERDEQSHSGLQKYQCHLCEKSFKDGKSLTKHLGHVHKLKKQFKCKVCKRYYMTKESLQGHMPCNQQVQKAEKATDDFKQLIIKPQPIDNNSFYLDAQEFNPAHISALPPELKCFEEEAPGKYQCYLCENSFKHNNYLTKHLGHVHKLDKQFRCNVCKRYYMTMESLQGHMKCHNQSQKTENANDNQLVLEPLLMDNDNFHFDAQESISIHFPPMPQDDLVNSVKEESSVSDFTLDKKESNINITQNDSTVANETSDLMICDINSLNGNNPVSTLNRESYECPMCRIICSDKSSMERHMQYHYKVNSSLKLDKRESTYSEHSGRDQQSHSGLQKYQCHLCEKPFKDNRALTKHLGHVHKLEKQFRCNVCKRYYMTKESLQEHTPCNQQSQKVENAKINRHVFEPQLIDKGSFHLDAQEFNPVYFSSMPQEIKCFEEDAPQVLQTYQTGYPPTYPILSPNHESQFKPYTTEPVPQLQNSYRDIQHDIRCQICKVSFSSIDHYAAHLDLCKNSRRFKCEICGVSVARKDDLNRHLNFVHRQHAKCTKNVEIVKNDRSNNASLPKKVFQKKENVTFSVNNLNEQKPFKCPICDVTSLSKKSLASHMNIHNNKNLCTICNKSFRTKTHLEKHMRTHRRSEKYTCSRCQAPFSNHRSYQEHILKNCSYIGDVSQNDSEIVKESANQETVPALDRYTPHENRDTQLADPQIASLYDWTISSNESFDDNQITSNLARGPIKTVSVKNCTPSFSKEDKTSADQDVAGNFNQIIYVSKGHILSKKESCNLLEGSSVESNTLSEVTNNQRAHSISVNPVPKSIRVDDGVTCEDVIVVEDDEDYVPRISESKGRKNSKMNTEDERNRPRTELQTLDHGMVGVNQSTSKLKNLLKANCERSKMLQIYKDVNTLSNQIQRSLVTDADRKNASCMGTKESGSFSNKGISMNKTSYVGQINLDLKNKISDVTDLARESYSTTSSLPMHGATPKFVNSEIPQNDIRNKMTVMDFFEEKIVGKLQHARSRENMTRSFLNRVADRSDSNSTIKGILNKPTEPSFSNHAGVSDACFSTSQLHTQNTNNYNNSTLIQGVTSDPLSDYLHSEKNLALSDL